MNNTQFRRLVLDTPTTARNNENAVGPTVHKGGVTPALGSRMRSSIPMTPRSIAGSSNNDFARQLAERNAELNPPTRKQFRSSAAPKGTKLGSGYQDRTQLRTSAEEDDKAIRIKALEGMVRLGQMDQATFEALRDEIIGGDVRDVHLVKGLDYKLLERVRKGEDVLSDRAQSTLEDNEDSRRDRSHESEVDVDEEFEKVEEKDVQPIVREEKVKRGEMAPPPPPVAGKKRTRDDILQELKASRLASTEKLKQSALGPKFSKVGQKRDMSRIVKDERGREVLIIVEEDGKVKRKVKKANADSVSDGHGLLMPDKRAKPLGMEVAPVIPPSPEEDVDDIFEGVGTDYNPLGDIEDEDDSDNSFEEPKAPLDAVPLNSSLDLQPTDSGTSDTGPPVQAQGKKYNWLVNAEEDENVEDRTSQNPLTDPTILMALKKASSIAPMAQGASNDEEATKLARRKKLLESDDRDAEDMDMEFGSSRYGDQEDGEDTRVKLSVWGDDGVEEGKGKGKGPRKRGGKKRKGNANSAADVLQVMERRKNKGQ